MDCDGCGMGKMQLECQCKRTPGLGQKSIPEQEGGDLGTLHGISMGVAAAGDRARSCCVVGPETSPEC